MLEMSREKKDKLKRYMLNADPFLWGLLQTKNKKQRLKELKAMGLLAQHPESTNASYGKINHDLLKEIGIEGVLERIVVPNVKRLFIEDVLAYFNRCWEEGQPPDLEYLRDHRLYPRRYGTREVHERPVHIAEAPSGYKDPAFIFFQIDTQYNYVLRWTNFAGVWFEEIEPLLGKGVTESSP